MLAWLLASTLTNIAVADAPAPLVTLGDLGAEDGSWVAVLDDCLQERQPSRWNVINRAASDVDGDSTEDRDATLQGIAPRLVVMGVAAAERSDPAAFRRRVEKLVSSLDGAPMLLVSLTSPGPAPQAIASAAPKRKAKKADPPSSPTRSVLASLAEEHDGVRHVDLDAQAGPGGALSDEDHARVAAAICDVVVEMKP